MPTIFHFIKRKKFQISTLLCFVLPPIGMFFLFIFSFVKFYKNLKEKNDVSFSLIALFFLSLLISTVCAAIQMKNALLLVNSLLILGYWGLYQYVVSNGSKENFQDYKWIVVFGGIYNCFIGWVFKGAAVNPVLGILTGTQQLGSDSDIRLFGSSYNSNFAMYLLLLAIAFIFAEMNIKIRNKEFRFLNWQIPLLLVLSYGIIDTGSRAGFTCMVILYLLFFLRLNKSVFVIVSVLFFIQLNNILGLLPRKDTVNPSFLVREKIWQHSVEVWEHHFLFGTTPFGFEGEYLKLFNSSMIHAHSLFFGFLSEYGIVGGLGFLALLVTTAYKSVTLFFYKEDKSGLLDYFLLSLPVIVITGILDEPTFSPQIAMLTIILLSYWDKYTKNFSFSFLALPNIRLKKQNQIDSSYTNVQQKTEF